MEIQESMGNPVQVFIRVPEERDYASDSVRCLGELINRIYDESECGIWKSSGARISVNEVEKRLRSGSMLLAEADSTIVGAVSVMRHDENTAEFGTLVAEPTVRGFGIGSKLVRAAEDWARDRGYGVMRLKILSPRDWKHPSKQFLEEWYSRIGYVRVGEESFQSMHPDKQEKLATSCIFSVWHKELS